ncbi:MAG: mevalonate kinase [Saprospiraceae bacterium]
MNLNLKKYPAKVLLFGEYSIIKGNSALAFPLNEYSGNWAFDNDVNNKNLKNWASYINKIQQANNADFQIDIERFNNDLSKGLFFNSNIPMGYGVGSSGALCAALYDEYSVENNRLTPKNDTIFTLKRIFQDLENFFHGSSSGIDPLICYLNQPLLLKGKTEANLIKLKKPTNNNGAVFLLNTQQPRQTEPLVQFFLKQLKHKEFETAFENEWCVYNEKIITAFINQNHGELFDNLRLLSEFQFNHLPPMIPKGFEKFWASSLKHNEFTIKLCGAGGGGFLLGFTQNWNNTEESLSKDFEIIKIIDL